MQSCISTSSNVSTNKFVMYNLICEQTTPGCSTKTTYPCSVPLKFTIFSQIIKCICWTTHHIHLISLHATFFLFCKIKNTFKGHSFQGWSTIKKIRLLHLRGHIKEEEFSACFKQWKHHMEKCIQSGGNYFEGDIIF